MTHCITHLGKLPDAVLVNGDQRLFGKTHERVPFQLLLVAEDGLFEAGFGELGVRRRQTLVRCRVRSHGCAHCATDILKKRPQVGKRTQRQG